MNFPLVVFVCSLLLLTLTVRVAEALRKRAREPKEEGRTDAGLLLSATLTLLYFIIGFSFSMAISRYDLRKNCEKAEAVAIGTAYSAADLLTPADATKVHTLLKRYLDQRVDFYSTRSADRASDADVNTVRLQKELWSAIRQAIPVVPPPLPPVVEDVSGLVVPM